MAGWQQVTIIGNVGRDPEMRYTQSGKPVCNFSVAVNEKFTTAAGEKREKATWFRVSAWAKLAEICNQYLSKGKQVHIVGTIEASAYTTQAGEPKASLELTARDVLFLSGGNEQEEKTTYNENNLPF